MSAEPETELILCPACKHALRVPLDWLGQQVQCPECKAMFRAPASDGSGGLTEAVLISRPGKPQTNTRKPFDAMLLLPAFGLLFCGIVGTIVDGVTAYRVLTEPAAVKEVFRQQLQAMRQAGFGNNTPEAERDRENDQSAEELMRAFRWAMPLFTAVSVVVFLGGLSIATRWNYRLAQLGSVAAALNVANLCCVPGAVAGLWALLMLSSEEGRAHFAK